jgi:DNA polymerase-1
VPDGLEGQFAQVEAYFGAFGFEVARTDELEADDLLASYADAEARRGGRTLQLTGDRDMFQCASENVTVLYVKTGTGAQGPDEVGPDEVLGRYGVAPDAVPDFIALRGDPSDGLPGAKGIGDKTAADLLRRHGSLEAVVEAADGESPKVSRALLDSAEELRAFKRIATLRPAEVKVPPDRPVDFAGGARAARERGMNRLAERLEKLAAEA